MTAMQVLIIDDSRAIRLLIAECVVSMGHVVVHTESGEEALEYIKQQAVDLILIDIHMPGMNGFETTKAIRTLKADDWFPIIFISTQVDDASYACGIKAGGDAYLEKPINPLRLQMQITAMERIYTMRKKLQAAQIGLIKLNDTLKYLSMFDQLTGLANRRNFDDTLRREFKLAQREKIPLSLLMCDIDFFKRYNDKEGHIAGDDCLSTVASAIESASNRPTDLACRYGGEEFAIILPKTDLSGAKDIAKKINLALQKRKTPHPDSPVSAYVTLSIGTASYNGQFEYPSELTQAADKALYRAKENGRNCIESIS
ncbi:MAG: diguanylate cyclase [Methylococcaceae bacterium]